MDRPIRENSDLGLALYQVLLHLLPVCAFSAQPTAVLVYLENLAKSFTQISPFEYEGDLTKSRFKR